MRRRAAAKAAALLTRMSGGFRVVFIRFVIDEIDRRSGRRQGLLRAAGALQYEPELGAREHDQLASIFTWFNTHLKRPDRLSLSPRPHRKAVALSWFRDTATTHLAKMRELQGAVERCGKPVRIIETRRVGYVVYRDEFQVVACPFRDTPA